MKKIVTFWIALVALGWFAVPGAFSQVKLAQTGFQYLSVSADARPAGMGDAFTTVEGSGGALFYNPAGMARTEHFIDVMANQTQWIADINHYSMSATISPANGRYGVFGLSVVSVDYGDIQGTMVWANSAGYVDTEVFSPSAIAIGVGYARSLTDKFSVGGQVKYVAQSLGKSVIPDEDVRKNVASVLAFDFGTIYRTGFRSLAFGMSVRNFSKEIKFEKEGFQLPLTFKIGLAVNAFDFFARGLENQSLLVVVDAVHPRSYSEYLNLGAEYRFGNIFSARAGYITAQDEYSYTFGFGIRLFGFAFDYAYTPFGVFDDVQRFTLRFSY